MAQGIMMEWEWRKRMEQGPRGRSRCWGAQCLQPRHRRLHDKRLLAAMLAVSAVIAALLPLFIPRTMRPETYQTRENSGRPMESIKARTISTVDYRMPEGIAAESRSFSREELLRGKMLFLNEEHPLPYGAPAPNTMSVANYGKGMVPVNDLNVRSGMETIAALTALFATLRGDGVSCFTVCRGTMTPWEQEEWRLSCLRRYSAGMSLEDAALRAMRETDTPGRGELMQEYAVELCLTGTQMASLRLDAFAEGRTLLQNAWRHGFYVEERESGWRLRYVGKAHAAAMVFLDVDMSDYLRLLHEKKVLQVRISPQTTYLIFCQPAQEEYVEFLLPKNAKWEVSLDNLGYAVAACVTES